jgi:hypothetical protein
LLEVGPANRAGASRTGPATKTFEPMEIDTIETMLDEARFLYDHRLGLLNALERDPLLGWTRLGEVEVRLDTMTDGVAAGGAFGRELAETAFADGSPAGVYVGISVLANIDEWSALWQQTATIALDDPAVLVAATLAITHAMVSQLKPAAAIEMLGRAYTRDDSLAPVVVEVAATLGMTAPSGAVAIVAAQARGSAIAGAANVLGRLAARGSIAVEPLLFQRWFETSDGKMREEVARAWLCVDRAAARSVISAAIEEPWAFSLLCLMGDQRAADRIKAVLHAREIDRRAYRLVGLWGDPIAVPVLLSRLDGHADAPAAAEALELITGAGLVVDRLVERPLPDEDLNEVEAEARAGGDLTVGVERESLTTIDCDRKTWEKWWQANQSRFRAGSPFRAGRPASVNATIAALRSETLPLSARAALGDELTLRHRARTPFAVTQMVMMQQHWLTVLANANAPPRATSA